MGVIRLMAGKGMHMQSPLVDPERSWLPLEKRMAEEKEPRRRQLLEQVRNHMRAELREQLEPVLATLVDEPVFNFFGGGMDGTLNGREPVVAYYKQMFAAGRMGAEFRLDRIAVDESSVVTEGVMLSKYSGEDLIAAGVKDVGNEPVQKGKDYLGELPMIIMWPADKDGKLIGENIYMGGGFFDRLKRIN